MKFYDRHSKTIYFAGITAREQLIRVRYNSFVVVCLIYLTRTNILVL